MRKIQLALGALLSVFAEFSQPAAAARSRSSTRNVRHDHRRQDVGRPREARGRITSRKPRQPGQKLRSTGRWRTPTGRRAPLIEKLTSTSTAMPWWKSYTPPQNEFEELAKAEREAARDEEVEPSATGGEGELRATGGFP